MSAATESGTTSLRTDGTSGVFRAEASELRRRCSLVQGAERLDPAPPAGLDTPPSNPAPGLKLVHCTGEIPDSLGNIDHFDLFVSIVPGR
jgi:hypothetical protein